MVSISVFAGLAGAGIIESELRKRGLSASTARASADWFRSGGAARVGLAGPEALSDGRPPRPMIIVAPGASSTAVLGLLQQGALDVITDGEPRLIAARTAALVRRLPADIFEAPAAPQWGAVRVDLRRRIVVRPDGTFPLHRPEYDLLTCLIRSGGAVCTPGQLAGAAWPQGGAEARKRLRTYIHHLRRKIEQDPCRPAILLTVHGRGYRVRLPDAARIDLQVAYAS